MHTNTLIIGASAAGLSCAAQLGKKNIDYRIIEKHPHVAHAWRSHYDRLHLHTNKASSSLPFLKFSKNIPKYPARTQVIKYLENYCQSLNIHPAFNTEARKIYREEGKWITQTNRGNYSSEQLIICTGNTNTPKRYNKKGLESFPGRILHSAEYKNGSEFKNKKVLVVGFGNSACEIAICLHEYGAQPSMSVRSPVNVIPRDILGIPVLQIGIWQSNLPPRFADQLNAPLLRLLIGDIEKYGLKKLPYGPIEQIVEHHQIPLLNIGTLELIKKGAIKIFGDIVDIHQDKIRFADGQEQRFDAIITAIGYEPRLNDMIDLEEVRKEDIKQKISHRKYFGKDNLYFCGFYVSPTGMLREIRIESEKIGEAISSGH